MKILSVFGTRPEAIKMAPVIKALCAVDWAQSLICVTAQHREMLDKVLDIFGIHPDYDLNIMEENQSLFHITIKGLHGIKEVLEAEKPQLVLVQGDTTTTFIASLAAFYLKIPIGHVEAGLRTNNKYKPFPEEINRRIVSVLADFHFAPSINAKEQLLREGVDGKKIFITGNTVIDALLWIINNNKNKQKVFDSKFAFLSPENKLILVTAPRRENFGRPLENICDALKKIVKRNHDVQVIYPVHTNPNVQNVVREHLEGLGRIHLIRPLNYECFVYLMNRSYLILTDSGGIQEEAPALGKPVLVLRDKTERPEAIEAGTARLVGTRVGTIVSNTESLLNNEATYQRVSKIANPFGDGFATRRIIEIIKDIFV